MYECFFWGGGGGGERENSQQNDAVITAIASRIVFLSTVLLIDDEGLSKITESWLISFSGLADLPETLYTYRMNLPASLHIEVDVLSSLMHCC